MNAKTHVIEIYDPNDYAGPNPIKVSGLGVIRGPDKTEYYLLQLRNPVEYNGDMVEQLIVQPRYFGDKILRVINDACTVGIMRVKANKVLQPEVMFEHGSCAFWGAGKISPSKIPVAM